MCKKCSKNSYKLPDIRERSCPVCVKVIRYKSARLCRYAEKAGTLCLSCAGKKYMPAGWKHTNEAKIKLRKAALGRGIPNYNKEACKLFDRINKEFGWNGYHAENVKEYIIDSLGYAVDFYEPNLNLVIEFDEKYHNTPKQKARDVKRQKEIENLLKCRFVRIKEFQINKWKEIINNAISNNTVIS